MWLITFTSLDYRAQIVLLSLKDSTCGAVLALVIDRIFSGLKEYEVGFLLLFFLFSVTPLSPAYLSPHLTVRLREETPQVKRHPRTVLITSAYYPAACIIYLGKN